MAAPKGVSFAARLQLARERDRAACDMQMAGATLEQIAAALGCHWSTASRGIARELRRRGLRRVWAVEAVEPERSAASC